MKNITSIVSSLALLLAVLATSTNAAGLGYGQECDAVKLCDSDFYTCRFGHCDCINLEQDFDVSQGRCVGAVGTSCGTDTQCGPLMECHDLFCACVAGYSPTIESQCKKGYDAVCTTSNDCNQDAQLQCTSDRKCRCNETTHVYDSETMLCRAKVGQICDPYIDTNGFPNGESGHRCIADGHCKRESTGYTCTCAEGFEVADGNVCKAVEGGDGGSGASSVSVGVAFVLSLAVLATRIN